MSPEAFGWWIRIHAQLATLALALVLHPVLTLRARRKATRWTHLTAELGAGLLLAATALGWIAYGTYRARVKPALWLGHPAAVLRFETKEHLAAMAAAMALGGALTLRVAHRSPAGREAAWIQLLLAFGLGLLAGGLGIFVGGSAQPGW
ncbi:MAG: hypothetical protein H6735_04440 [Alphaproteobacteria bacterium]|nr:hypothetical protein [Alphaproteobacteria bacterium]